MKRCSWCNLNNPQYIKYHDEEWGNPVKDDLKLFEFLILEMFQAGLSWEIILNKRENFKRAFDNFNYCKIAYYDENKINELMSDTGIIRNKLKIIATINNAKIFLKIQKEYKNFSNYIWKWTNNKTIYISDNKITKNNVSDYISKDLKKRGMKFVGSTIIYSYLQAIGIINSHEKECFLYDEKRGSYDKIRKCKL